VAPAAVWTVQVSGTDASLRGVSAVDDRTAWVSGSKGTVLRTVDGGATWTAVPGARPPIAITVGPSGSDLSLDLGRTWAPIAGPAGFHSLFR